MSSLARFALSTTLEKHFVEMNGPGRAHQTKENLVAKYKLLTNGGVFGLWGSIAYFGVLA